MSLIINAVLPASYLNAIYMKLARLPKSLNDIQMSDGENDPRHPVSFEDLVHNRNIPVNPAGGYFLHAKDACYMVGFFKDEVTLFISCDSDDIALKLTKLLAEFPVFYAYACQYEERKHQNRITARKSYGIDEMWVGRDYHRYLPGLYWLNLIPKSLLQRHSVTEDAIKTIAISCEMTGEINYLIQLYPTSSDWEKHVVKIDKWRKETPGVFYKQAAETALTEASTFLEASDATSKWK